MSAFKIHSLGGLTRALHEAGKACSELLKSGKSPVIEVREESRKRSAEQNRLQRMWVNEAAKQGDQTAEEYRAYCKLHFGVPILRAENEEFRIKYDRIIKPMPYETKLELMAEPFDFPVTRLMTSKQKTKYLDQCYVFLTGQGYVLTEPKGKAA